MSIGIILLCLTVLKLILKINSLKRIIEEDKKEFEKVSIEKDENEYIMEKKLEESRRKNALEMYEANLSAKSEMLSNIAHQWRQPLNNLILILANLEDAYKYDELDEEYFNSLVTKSRKLINNMSATIDDFRNMFKSPGQREAFYPYEAIKSLLYMNEENLLENDINIILPPEGKDFSAYGDKGQYSQAVMNVINNSIDAHSTVEDEMLDKRIEIKIYESGNYTVTEILDNAGGLSEEELEKLYDMYYSTKDSDSGTGLGLYISKNIIENILEGTIFSENDMNGLLTVISIPRKEDNIE